TNGHLWWNNTGWNSNAHDLSTWYGIEVDDEGYVVKINLPENNLKDDSNLLAVVPMTVHERGQSHAPGRQQMQFGCNLLVGSTSLVRDNHLPSTMSK
ncbi:unnamed protein product, partial [Choristocarpus tenellus]